MSRPFFGGNTPDPIPWHPLPHMEEYLVDLEAMEKSAPYIHAVHTAFGHFGVFAQGEGMKHPDEIERAHLLRFQVYLGEQTSMMPRQAGQQLSPAYRAQLMKYIRTWINWLIRMDYITHNPWDRIRIVRPKKVPKPLEPDEVEQLFDAHARQAFSISPFFYHRREVILVLLYGWGLRIHELAALTVTGMDVRQDFVTSINKRSSTGTNDSKVLPYADSMKQVVQRYLTHRAKHAVPHIDTLLITKAGEPVTTDMIYKIVTELGQRASVRINPHRLRDTFGTTMLDNDVPVERVMLMMGHTQRSQTLAYSRVNDHRLKASHDEAMDPILRQLLRKILVEPPLDSSNGVGAPVAGAGFLTLRATGKAEDFDEGW